MPPGHSWGRLCRLDIAGGRLCPLDITGGRLCTLDMAGGRLCRPGHSLGKAMPPGPQYFEPYPMQELVSCLTHHKGTVHCGTFSNNGQLFASCSSDKTAVVVSTDSGQVGNVQISVLLSYPI